MWDIDDDSRDEILSRCMRLNELYQAEYFEVKKSMEEVNNFNFFFFCFFFGQNCFCLFFLLTFFYIFVLSCILFQQAAGLDSTFGGSSILTAASKSTTRTNQTSPSNSPKHGQSQTVSTQKHKNKKQKTNKIRKMYKINNENIF